MYWTPHNILSYNCDINIICGGRGIGKTTAMKLFCLKREGKTIWIRRKRDELSMVTKTFVNGIPDGMFDIGSIEVEKDENTKIDFISVNGEPKIYFMCLSLANKYKGNELPCDFAVFDEFTFLETKTQRYIKDEVIQLMELLNTTFRTRKFRLVMLSNYITILNPYWAAWNLPVEVVKNKVIRLFDNTIALEFPSTTPEFADMYHKSTIGRISRIDSHYNDYVEGNSTLSNNEPQICSVNPKARFTGIALRADDNTRMYIYSAPGAFYVSDRGDPTAIAYADNPKNANESNPHHPDVQRVLVEMVGSGKVHFTDATVAYKFNTYTFG